MKTSLLFLLFSVLCFNYSNAQYQPYSRFKTRHFEDSWSFGIGTNVVDYSGNNLSKQSEIKKNRHDNWAFETPITLSAEYHFNAQFSINATAAINAFKSGKIINGQVVSAKTQPQYFALDIFGTYSFRTLLKSSVIDPYVSIGVGYVKIEDYYVDPDNTLIASKAKIMSNPSIGLNVWFSKHWALNMHAIYKTAYTKNTSNLLQYGLGVVYLLKNY